jgi:hypothetical protein
MAAYRYISVLDTKGKVLATVDTATAQRIDKPKKANKSTNPEQRKLKVGDLIYWVGDQANEPHEYEVIELEPTTYYMRVREGDKEKRIIACVVYGYGWGWQDERRAERAEQIARFVAENEARKRAKGSNTTGTDTTQKAPKRFTLDGEPIPDMGSFAVENDLDPETLNDIGRLAVGETLVLGGGATAECIFKREE